MWQQQRDDKAEQQSSARSLKKAIQAVRCDLYRAQIDSADRQPYPRHNNSGGFEGLEAIESAAED